MEKNMRFWLILGPLAIQNKSWAYHEQLLRPVFQYLCGQKNIFLKKHCSVRTKKFNDICFIFISFILFLSKNRLSIHNQLRIALLKTPPCDPCLTSIYWLGPGDIANTQGALVIPVKEFQVRGYKIQNIFAEKWSVSEDSLIFLKWSDGESTKFGPNFDKQTFFKLNLVWKVPIPTCDEKNLPRNFYH